MQVITTLTLLVALLVWVGIPYGSKTYTNVLPPEQLGWEVVQSPDTGKCYEVVVYSIHEGMNRAGWMGMEAIDCSYLPEEESVE